MLCRDVEEQELATQYVARALDAALEEDFEAHLLDCSQCQTVLETLLALREELEARSQETRPDRGFVHAEPISVAARRAYTNANLRSGIALRWIPAAATVAFALSLGYWGISRLMKSEDLVFHLHQPSPGPAPTLGLRAGTQAAANELLRLGAVQPPPYTMYSLIRRMSSNDDRGMAAYVEKRYDDAVELLEAALKDQPGAPDINFYLGISLLMKGKPEESVGPLQTAAANEKSPYQQSAHFFLAKAYLQTADLARAENELQIAASTPGSRASEARSLLERIHALRSTPSSEAF